MPEARATLVPEGRVDDHWEPARCAQGKRVVDINHARHQVRFFCDRCRTTHTVDVGVRYTGDIEQ